MTKSVLTPKYEYRGSPYTHLSIGDWQGVDYQFRYGYFRCELGIAGIQQWRATQKGKTDADTRIVVISGGRQLDRSWRRIHPDQTLSRLARNMLEECR